MKELPYIIAGYAIECVIILTLILSFCASAR